MDADAALKWLEGLATQQRATAEEPSAQPEARGETTTPTSPASAEPTPPAFEAPTGPQATAMLSEDDRLARLADRLGAQRRAKEAEIAARFETQRAQQEAARREIQQRMEQKQAQIETVRSSTGPLRSRTGTGQLAKPGTGPLAPKPGTGPLREKPAPTAAAREPEPPVERAEPAAHAAPAAQTAIPAPKPKYRPKTTPLPRPRRGSKSPYAAEAPENVFAQARQQIADGDYETAAEALGYLVSGGHMVEEIIAHVEQYSAQNPTTPPLLQVLGDAYMKDNHLQKALDAYRMALGQL
jgi:cytochrome c-type biogenesis protein CcmH/NrfG